MGSESGAQAGGQPIDWTAEDWNTGGAKKPNPLDSVGEAIRKAYYFFEDKYYDALDYLNRFVPVYKLTDPVDRVIPSFVVLLCLGVFFAGGLVLMMVSASTPPNFPTQPTDTIEFEEMEDIESPPDATGNNRISLDPGGDLSHSTNTAGVREVEFTVKFVGPDEQLLTQNVTYSIKYNNTSEYVVRDKVVTSGLDRAAVTNSCPPAIRTNNSCPDYVITAKSGTFPDASVRFNFLPSLTQITVPFQSLSGNLGGTAGGCGSACPPGIPTHNLTVNVFGPNQTPIVGALVVIERLSGTPPAPVSMAFTVAPGSRRFENLPADSYRVTVSGEPQYSMNAQDIVLSTDRVLNVTLSVLNRNRRIAFELVNGITNQPVNGQKAFIYHGSVPVPLDPEHQQLYVQLPPTSNRFSLNVAASTTPYYVVVSEPGYLFATRLLMQSGTESNHFDMLHLFPVSDENMAHIHVTAIDWTTQPIAQAEVFVWKKDFPFALNASPILTNAQGKAEPSDELRLGEGDYRVLVQKIGFDANYFGGAASDYNHVDKNKHWFIRAILRNSQGDFRANVKNDARQPLADANVTLFHVDGGQVNSTQNTPASGSVTFSGLNVTRPYYAKVKKTGFLTEHSGLLRLQRNKVLDKNFYLTSSPATPAGLVLQYRGLFEYTDSGERFPVGVFEPGKAYWAEFRIIADKSTPYSNGLFTAFTPSDATHFEAFASTEPPRNPLRINCLGFSPALSTNVPLFGTGYSISNPENTSSIEMLTGCDPVATSFVLGQLGLNGLSQGVFSIEVNVKTPADTPMGTPVQVSAIVSALTSDGGLRADANKSFAVGSLACDTECGDNPRDLSWNFFLKTDSGEIPIYATGSGPTLAPDSTGYRLKTRVWNLKNNSYTNYKIRISSNAIKFQSPVNPAEFVSSLEYPVTLAPYANYLIDNLRIQSPPTAGTPTVNVEFLPPTGGPGVESGSSPKHLPFTIAGTLAMGHSLTPNPLAGALSVRAHRVDAAGNDIGPLEGVQIHFVKPVACANAPPADLPSTPSPQSGGSTNSEGTKTLNPFFIDAPSCALFRFTKTNYVPHLFFVSAAEFNTIILPESESCIVNTSADASVPILTRNPAPGSTANSGAIELLNDCPGDYVLKASVLPIAGNATSNWGVSLSPAAASEFTITKNNRTTIHVTVGANTPQGLIPIGLWAKKAGTIDAFELVEVLDIQVNDQLRTFDIIE